MADGFLLALEGIDGSGTTTQAARLASALAAHGRQVVATAEPSQGPIGLFIRAALTHAEIVGDVPLALLFAADRLDHLQRQIEPALAAGAVVITDRYLLSSLAYQSECLPLDWVLAINAQARRPDASILLRVPPEVAADRRHQRGGARERFDDIERQRGIARRYEAVLELSGAGPTYAIDAAPDFERVAQALAEIVERLLGLRMPTDVTSPPT